MHVSVGNLAFFFKDKVLQNIAFPGNVHIMRSSNTGYCLFKEVSLLSINRRFLPEIYVSNSGNINNIIQVT